MTASRTAAIAGATAWFDAGALEAELARRVAFATESQNPARAGTLLAYLTDEIGPAVERLGFRWQLWPNPTAGAPPMLFAERHEDASVPTVLTYGHGDVVAGYDAQWKDGRSPWQLSASDGKWYGRGTADNKGQHTINLAALGRVLETARAPGVQRQAAARNGRGSGLTGPARRLRAECRTPASRRAHRLRRAAARVRSRDHLSGLARRLQLRSRRRAARGRASLGQLGRPARQPRDDSGERHRVDGRRARAHPGRGASSGADSRFRPARARRHRARRARRPGHRRRLGRAVACRRPSAYSDGTPWKCSRFAPATPTTRSTRFRRAPSRTCRFALSPDAIGARSFPPSARIWMARGFSMVKVSAARARSRWPRRGWIPTIRGCIGRARRSRRPPAQPPAILPNLGGSLPNDCFADVLGLPTIWVPHSYPACSQHAPNEHMLARVAREGLQIMTGLFWDLGAPGTPARVRA